MKSYDQLQQELDVAFNQFFEQRGTAVQILSQIANVLTNDCRIPRANVGFMQSLDEPSKEQVEERERALGGGNWTANAATTIRRDSKGTWRCTICIRVDRPPQKPPIKLGQSSGSGKEGIVVTVPLNVRFLDDSTVHVTLTKQSEEFGIKQPVTVYMAQTVAKEVLREVEAMAEWLKTGKGEKPAIGFNNWQSV